MAGVLLDGQYDTVMTQGKVDLQKEAPTFGISFVGDGATVKRMPLVNMMAMGIHCPPVTIKIVDATGHMETGGKKDAVFIARQFEPKIK